MDKTASLQLQFARFAGEMAESFSFSRSLGQIYGLLYATPHSLSLEDISLQLKMSKGNASINVRTLESWGAVRAVFVSGSRRDHYEANRDLKELCLRRMQEGMGKRLENAQRQLDGMLKGANGADKSTDKKSIQELNALLGKARKLTAILPKVLKYL
jgi:DNA-binding transcriptional regulator GbsR (MarR family)